MKKNCQSLGLRNGNDGQGGQWLPPKAMTIQEIIIIFLTLVVVIETWILIRQGIKKDFPEVILRRSLGVLCENVGKETAYNITIDVCELNVFSISFQPISFLKPGENNALGYSISGKDKETDEIIKAGGVAAMGFPFFEHLKVAWYWLFINYMDKNEKRYQTVVYVNCEKRNITIEKLGKA